MVSGSHVVIFSKDAEADRALMGRNSIDASHGWMIYEMPPAEVAVHPLDGPIRHELHMMCDDVEEPRAKLSKLGLHSAPVRDLGYGLVSSFEMPSGATIGFYQPRHKRPV